MKFNLKKYYSCEPTNLGADNFGQKWGNRRSGGKRGFTLIEIIVASAIFLVVMVISTGALLSIVDANAKAQSLETVINNLNFAIENMQKNIRTGFEYKCNGSATDCAGGTSFTFTRAENGLPIEVTYSLFAGKIFEKIDTGAAIPITAEGVVIEKLNFYLEGVAAAPEDLRQPKVIMVIKGETGGKEKLKSKFSIQTTVSMKQKLDDSKAKS